MSGVDVLAVMDDFSEDYRLYIPQFHAQNRKGMKRRVSELNEARAAVAGLIEAQRQIKHSIQQARIPGNDWKRELALIENTVDAALARCRGGAA